ncbi:MAG: Rpn family recombination-promoting nuclease/putative transposase [Bacteroidales bacterium]|nr:Rpn family recombination-promoting nuclease/putative transposase [Bacteroidales bacterium]
MTYTEAEKHIVSFDWAAKYMLRDKANFDILEGLITVLLNEKVTIQNILESESNQTDPRDKYNRVDVKALNSKGEIILVEIQLNREQYFIERVLYGVSKTITEHMYSGDGYGSIKKVYSIGILYFNLGEGSDYVYHGTTSFRGIHTNDTLKLSQKELGALTIKTSEDIFPEYFLIRVKAFDKVAETPLEEWLDYLKSCHIKDDTTVPGLQEAKRKLKFLMMTPQERRAYERHWDDVVIEEDVISTSREEGYYDGRIDGLEEGRAEGLEEGRAEGRIEGLEEGKVQGRAEGLAESKIIMAKRMLDMGYSIKDISEVTRLSVDEINSL